MEIHYYDTEFFCVFPQRGYPQKVFQQPQRIEISSNGSERQWKSTTMIPNSSAFSLSEDTPKKFFSSLLKTRRKLMALYIMFLDCLMKLSLLIFQWQLRLPGLQWNS